MTTRPSRVRPPARDDLPAIVALLNACDEALLGEPDTTLADLEADWLLEGFDPARDAWVAEAGDGGLVGYAYVGDQHRTGELEADLWVRPGWDEAELPARLLRLVERRAAALARERGYGTPALSVFCHREDAVKREALRRHGYALARTVARLRIDLPGDYAPPPPPPGVTVRPVAGEADERAAFAVLREAFADHFRQSAETYDSWRARHLGHADHDPSLWLLALAGSGPVGALLAWDHGDLGWVEQLGVRREWRRRGVGRALLGQAFAALAARGRRRVELGVDTAAVTRPLALYLSLGMRVTTAYDLYTKPLGE